MVPHILDRAGGWVAAIWPTAVDTWCWSCCRCGWNGRMCHDSCTYAMPVIMQSMRIQNGSSFLTASLCEQPCYISRTGVILTLLCWRPQQQDLVGAR